MALMNYVEANNSTFFNINPYKLDNKTAYMYYGGYGQIRNNTKGYYWLACGV